MPARRPFAIRGYRGWIIAAIAVATLLPLTAGADQIHWNDPLGGSFHDASNWNPATIPGPSDIATFGTVRLDRTYTVTFSEDVVTRAISTGLGADATLDLGGHAYTVTQEILVPTGNLTLAGGTLTSPATLIGWSDPAREAASFTQNGGTHAVRSGTTRGTLNLIAPNRTYHLNGGTLDADVMNRGSFNHTGGTVAGDVRSEGNGVYTVSRGSGSGAGTRVIQGDVRNFGGEFRVTGTDVRVGGEFINSRGVVRLTGGATLHLLRRFTNVEDSYVTAGPGDVIATSDNFWINEGSADRTLWDTDQAELRFVAGSLGGQHSLRVVGTDVGRSAAGYVDNFAWGTLALDAGQSLALLDPDGPPERGALYVGVLSLAEGLSHIGRIRGQGHNIYYDPSLPGNAYLAGGTYPLPEGGAIIPIPEPGVAWAGLVAALAFLRRRRNNSGATAS